MSDDDLDTLYQKPVGNTDEFRELFEKVYRDGDDKPLEPYDYQRPVVDNLMYGPTLWERFLMWLGRLLGCE